MPIAAKLAELMRAEGAYFTDPQETDALRRTVFHPDGSLNTAVVGKSAAFVAEAAGFRVPAGTRILVTPADQDRAGRTAFAREDDHRAGLVRGGWLGAGL